MCQRLFQRVHSSPILCQKLLSPSILFYPHSDQVRNLSSEKKKNEHSFKEVFEAGRKSLKEALKKSGNKQNINSNWESTKKQAKESINGAKQGKGSINAPDVMSKFPTPVEFNNKVDSYLGAVPSGQEIVKKCPPKYHPYLNLSRVDKPIGSWLLFLPGAWAICFAAGPFSLPSLVLLAKFGVGSVLMRGAGCTINDYWDVDIDKRVVRTRRRPLASGVLSKNDALKWLGVQLGGSFLILLTLNVPTILLGVTSLAFVGAYPLFKRISNYPQLFLGLTMNYSALMGYCAATGGVNATAIMLYTAGAMWTVMYDTVYAHMDKTDDIRAGVGSTAIAFGDNSQKMCIGFAVGMTILLQFAGLVNMMGISYFASVGIAGVLLLKGLQTIDLTNSKECWDFFVMNRNIGWLILIGIVLGKFL